MWIVRLALRRPYTFVVAALLLLLLTPFVLLRTPTDIFSGIDIPVVRVIWQYAGLNAQEIEQRIIYNHERSLSATVNDIEHIESTSYNGKELFRLAQMEKLGTFVRVPQTLARAVEPGQLAELALAELPGRKFDAKVVRTAGALEPDSRTLLTELEVDNTPGQILAGSYAQVRFNEANPEAALALPANTLLFRAEGIQVGVVGAGGKVELKRVELGRDFGQTVEIINGVETSDRVILNPPDSLAAGATVRVAESAKTVAAKSAKPVVE
jgi:hypothetical protein